jgi:hypothetical protein
MGLGKTIRTGAGDQALLLARKALTRNVNREILREAVFAWMVPFEAVLSITLMAFFSCAAVSSWEPEDIASTTPLMAFFIWVFRDRLRCRLASLCFALLMADLWLANVTSPMEYNSGS